MGKTQLANVEVVCVNAAHSPARCTADATYRANLPPAPPPHHHPAFYRILAVAFRAAGLARAIAATLVEPHAGGLRFAAVELLPGPREAVVEVPVQHLDIAHFHGRLHIIHRLRVAFASWIIFMTILWAMSVTRGQVSTVDISVNFPAARIAVNEPVEAILGQTVAANAEMLNAVVAGVNLMAAEPDYEANSM